MALTNIKRHLFPLVAAEASATLAIPTGTTGTITHVCNERKLLINAYGSTGAAETFNVSLDGPDGLLYFVDITSLNAGDGGTAAAVVVSRGENSFTLDDVTESAALLFTSTGFSDASAILAATTLGTTIG
jgi:hypothetical protein